MEGLIFSSQEISNATGLTVRQVQHHIEKNVILYTDTKCFGRGKAYEFDEEDLIRFLIIRECVQFNLSYEMKQMVMKNYYTTIKKKEEVKQYIKEKLFLKDNNYFYMWCERPLIGENEEVFGCLISNDGEDFPPCYFRPEIPHDKTTKFNGLKLEEHSMSLFLIDIDAVLKKQHKIIKEARNKSKKIIKKKSRKSTFGEKGAN